MVPPSCTGAAVCSARCVERRCAKALAASHHACAICHAGKGCDVLMVNNDFNTIRSHRSNCGQDHHGHDDGTLSAQQVVVTDKP